MLLAGGARLISLDSLLLQDRWIRLVFNTGDSLPLHLLVIMCAMTQWEAGPQRDGGYGTSILRSGYLLELGAFAGADLACEFPAASIMEVFAGLQRIDLSNNRISGK